MNSALQRGRATLASRDLTNPSGELSNEQRAMLDRYVDAFLRYDIDSLVALLREDARWAMPPAPLWFDGRAAIVRLFALFPIDWQGRADRISSPRRVSCWCAKVSD